MSAGITSRVLLELATVTLIVLAAAAVRWPELMNVPRFTDESEEVLVGVRIARGESLPLVNWRPHLGVAFNYLVAAALVVGGPGVEAGRLVVWLLGALTAVPTYLLGRSLGGIGVGTLAALLVATSATHIVVNSHIAYSHSIMPLFATAGLWLIHSALVDRSGRRLAAGLTALGVAVQFHPSAVVLLPSVAAYLALRRRAVDLRWLVLGSLGAGIAVVNLIVFNAMTGLSGVSETIEVSGRYVSHSEGWGSRLVLLLGELPLGIAGLVSESNQPGAVWHPFVIACSILLMAGLARLAHRREWLPVLVAISATAAISLFNGRLAPVVPWGRHYALLLPVAYVCMAFGLLGLQAQWISVTWRPWLARLVMLCLATLLITCPLFFVHQYYERAYRSAQTNRPILAALDVIVENGQLDRRVYLDDQLEEWHTLSGGRALGALRTGLSMRGQEYDVVDIERSRLPLGPLPDASRILVLRQDDIEVAEQRYHLDPLPGEPGPGAPLRVVRASAAGR